MLLTELYDNPLPFKMKVTGGGTGKDAVADVVISGRKIRFTGEQHGKNWSLMFSERQGGEDVYDLTGHGDEVKIFSTLKKFTQELINRFECPKIVFTADKTEEAGQKRADLYYKMFQRFNFTGYKLHRTPSKTLDTFQLVRDGEEPNKYD